MKEFRESDLVFWRSEPRKTLVGHGARNGAPPMKIGDATVHGFRSSFRDWASECTDFTNGSCEAALAHVIENKAEAAYRRGDLFDKRRKLMNSWAAYCGTPKGSKVVAFRRKA